MEITKKQARSFIRAIKYKNPKMHSFECRIQERTPLDLFGKVEPSECNELNDTDYFDDSRCDEGNMKRILEKIYAGEHPNVISISLYTRGKDSQLWDHVWVEYAKEQFERFLQGEKFESQTT